MDGICVVGLSWRHADENELARYTVPLEERAERLAQWPELLGAREVFYLATCNRVELALVADGETPLAAYRKRVFEALTDRSFDSADDCRLRIWGGEGAVEHLFVVAAGLDSARVGEHEIPGQMKKALELARSAKTLGPKLEWVIGEALRVGRGVRQRSEISTGHLSLAQIALEQAERWLADDAHAGGTVALVGVSDMTRRCGDQLRSAGVPLVIVNRSVERAEALAQQWNQPARSLGDFLEDPDAVEVVISATGSSEPLFKRPTLERLAARSPSGGGPLLIDLAIPADVDPEACAAVGLSRIGMDEITAAARRTSQRRAEEAAYARELVDEALEDMRRQGAHRALSPVMGELSRRYRETAATGVERLLAKELEGLDEEAREAVQQWAETLARRLAHIPMVGLRALAAEVGLPAVRTFLQASGDPMIAEMSDAVSLLPSDLADAEDAQNDELTN